MTFKDVLFSKAFYFELGFLIFQTAHVVILICHLVVFILCIVVMRSWSSRHENGSIDRKSVV